jgi:hypothetical protein
MASEDEQIPIARSARIHVPKLTKAPSINEAALADLHSFVPSERGTDNTDSEVKLSKERKKDHGGKADGLVAHQPLSQLCRL